ncbi:MAG: hypothetical protein GYA21_04075 [Myxococcales bacterium]|nr:hypothetical protein [Myxococcales bacterium]
MTGTPPSRKHPDLEGRWAGPSGKMRVACATLLAGALLCACSAVPENRYFMMAYALLPPKPAPRVDATIRVRQFDITPAYDQERLVYRYSPFEFQYYNYMLWAVKPQKMLTDLFRKQLSHSGRFAAVAGEFGEQRPDYELSGMVEAIEELDAGDEWFAHLNITLRLSRYGQEQALWTGVIEQRRKVFNKQPVYVVKALSEILEQETGRIIDELAAFLSTQALAPREGARPEAPAAGERS